MNVTCRNFTFWFCLISFCMPLIVSCPAEAARNEIAIGPEILYLKRVRSGGTEQSGTLYGVRGRIEHLGRYLIYLGVEGAYAGGTLCGHSGNGTHLKSHFSQSCIEGRIGYTFEPKTCWFSLTPFLGAGYFLELNHYIRPSPVKVHFDNRFGYGAAGFRSKVNLMDQLSIGLNFTAMYSFNGKVKVSHDPDYDSATLEYMQKINYRVELPINYVACFRGCPVELSLVPFFEYRHYGKKLGVPFDFLNTHIRDWGADLQYVYRF